MTKQATKKITTRVVEGLKPGESIADNQLSGFFVRCQKKGKSYFVRKFSNGKRHFVNIGTHGQSWSGEGSLTEAKARKQAGLLIAGITGGDDPTAVRNKARQMPTLNEFADDFFAGYGLGLKPNTLKDYISTYNFNVKGQDIGTNTRLDQVTRQQLSLLHRSLRDKPRTANKVLQIVSSMFTEAQNMGLVKEDFNPAKRIKHFTTNKRQRFLTIEELEAIGRIMAASEKDGSESIYAIAAIRLLTFTGARKSEILSMRWSWIDFQRSVINLPDSKTNDKPIHLSPSAIEVLRSLPRVKNNPFVIVGEVEGKHWVNLRKVWLRIHKKAGLEPSVLPDGSKQLVRLHDLRHTFASLAINGGASLPMIGALLGHSQVSTTARYAHLMDDPLKGVNNKAGDMVADAFGKKP